MRQPLRKGRLQRDAVICVCMPLGWVAASDAVESSSGGRSAQVGSDARPHASVLKRQSITRKELPFNHFTQGDTVLLVEGDVYDFSGKHAVPEVVMVRSQRGDHI